MAEMIKERLAINLKKLRKAVGLSQSDLAEKLDISLRFYQSAESGQSLPGSDILEKVTKFYKIDPSRLLSGDTGENSPTIENLAKIITEQAQEIESLKSRLDTQNVPTDLGLPDDIIQGLKKVKPAQYDFLRSAIGMNRTRKSKREVG